MSENYTSGPWAMNECVSDEGGGCICFEIWGDDADPIALVEMPMARYAAWAGGEVLAEYNETTRANAYLIAGAPELFEALVEAVSYAGKSQPWVVRALTALDKAQGRP